MTAATAPPHAGTATVASMSRRPRAVERLVLLATMTCAACGLVYELALISLGGYLIGNTVYQTSIVLGVFVFSMGIGAVAAKRLVARPLASFAAVEAALGLVGGLSVVVLYAGFAWLGLYQPLVVVLSLVIGALIGAEIPVLMTLLQRLVPRDAASTVADLFAADYLGALVGGLAFPFVLLPTFGLLRGAMVAGALNVASAAVVVGLFARSVSRRNLLATAGTLGVVVVTLAVASSMAADFEVSARQALYDDPIVHAERTPYQEIVVTRSLGRDDVRLFLDGKLQFSSVDEYRYHEALVHPAMNGPRRRVLILGGGDGLAAEQVLRYPDVEEVVLVELDRAVVRLARNDATLRRINGNVFENARLRVEHADAFTWVRSADETFDVVIADFPDPEDVATAKLYSQEMYGLLGRIVSPGGRLVVQAGSPHFAREPFWCIERTVAAAGWRTVPYHVDVPSFGNWGFVLAARDAPPDLALPPDAPPLESLDAPSLAAAAHFAPDRGPVDVEVSTLVRPVVLDYQRAAWRDY